MKPNGYFVTKRETCKTCGGNCLIQHGLWREYWQTHGPAGSTPTEAEVDRWFSARGYRLDTIPPEEIECPECDGLGYIDSEAPFADILAEILPGLIAAMGYVRKS